jgi:ATPase family associated with various cellular activities (AAA)
MSILQDGGEFLLGSVTDTHPVLPLGVYMMKFCDRRGFYLQKKADFKLPTKIYGDHSVTKRWMTSYTANGCRNMGIILSGVKGGGKTITAQKFCIESGLPVIMINHSFKGPAFIDFITSPKLGKCIIFIDEFEKVYDTGNYASKEHQKDLLMLMDGAFPTNLIFLLTVNEMNVDSHLVNRLNRVKYRKEYSDLDPEVMETVIEDLLVNKEHEESIYEFFKAINICTFDLLVNLINEMNLFNENAVVCGKHLNLSVDGKTFEVREICEKGKEHRCDNDFYHFGKEYRLKIRRNATNYLTPIEGAVENEEDEYENGHEYYLELTHLNSIVEKITPYKYKVTEKNHGYVFIFTQMNVNLLVF